MISEQMTPMPDSVEQKLTSEQQAEIDKRKLFEDRLQACYALRKMGLREADVLPGSPEQDRFLKRITHPELSNAFRAWFEELDKSGSSLIPDYLASHTEEDIIGMKDMDAILAVLEASRHHRTLH